MALKSVLEKSLRASWFPETLGSKPNNQKTLKFFSGDLDFVGAEKYAEEGSSSAGGLVWIVIKLINFGMINSNQSHLAHNTNLI